MKSSPFPARRLRRALFSVAGCAALGLLASSCQEDNECAPPVSSTLVVERLTQSTLERVDVLLAIDNSRSMAEKQQVLALAVGDLVRALVNPPCVDPVTGAFASQPAAALDKCLDGAERRSKPILDMHVGIISSSLGGHGSDACSTSGAGKQSNNDKGHLLARQDPTMAGTVETYYQLGFLAWDPAQKLAPPGEADAEDDTDTDANMTALVPSLEEMVIGVGQIGCGYESQLESWYRFLVDPSPPDEVTLDATGKVLLKGVDGVLLDQRKAFLRPDSLLAILMLSDENDCSIREEGQFYYAAQQKAGNGSVFHLPRGRAICETSPDDQCCFSCGQSGPKDDAGSPICGDDPSCKTADGKTVYLDEIEDNINLRCWNQKRRFGIDFLYGIDRYVDALRSQTVTDRNGQVVPNPIFSDLDTSDSIANVRSSNLVFLAGIVGVPWQDIARTNANGAPDLAAGINVEGKPLGGFKNADELSAPLPGKDYTTWDVILGDPDKYPAAESLPKDPLMIESVDMRTGTNPITGDPLVPASQPLGNAINGHEWSIPKRDDLQYACIFPLPQPVDCAAGNVPSCDCEDPANDSPLCAVDPATGNPTMQKYAKAYPGIRELQVLKKLGSQGIVGSVCPVQLGAPLDADFGYRAAVSAIVDRLNSTADGQCLQRTLSVDEGGRVDCVVIEATVVGPGTCSAQCAAAGRAPVSAEHQGIVDDFSQSSADYNCFCEIPQLTGEALAACQNDPATMPTTASGAPVDGYCYVDAAQGVGDPEVVEHCPTSDKRILRFVGAGEQSATSTVLIACNIETTGSDQSCAR